MTLSQEGADLLPLFGRQLGDSFAALVRGHVPEFLQCGGPVLLPTRGGLVDRGPGLSALGALSLHQPLPRLCGELLDGFATLLRGKVPQSLGDSRGIVGGLRRGCGFGLPATALLSGGATAVAPVDGAPLVSGDVPVSVGIQCLEALHQLVALRRGRHVALLRRDERCAQQDDQSYQAGCQCHVTSHGSVLSERSGAVVQGVVNVAEEGFQFIDLGERFQRIEVLKDLKVREEIQLGEHVELSNEGIWGGGV